LAVSVFQSTNSTVKASTLLIHHNSLDPFDHNYPEASVDLTVMAYNDPGLAQLGAEAHEPIKGAVHRSMDLEEGDSPVAADQLDERFETSRWEIW
jgi:hypothetical protein